MGIGEELAVIGISTVVDIIRDYAVAKGQNPDEACHFACQKSPEFRMLYARHQAYLRVTGKIPDET